MKAIHVAAIAVIVAALTTFLLLPSVLSAQPSYKQLPFPVIVKKLPYLTTAQDAWAHRLELCESGGDPNAINPKDRDGTPSYGAWQFKPDTFWYYADKYGVKTPNLQKQIDTTPVVDGKHTLRSPSFDRHYQYLVLVQMILHRDQIDWHQQFPDCVRKIGLPPTK